MRIIQNGLLAAAQLNMLVLGLERIMKYSCQSIIFITLVESSINSTQILFRIRANFTGIVLKLH